MPPTLADRLAHILTAIDTIQTALAGKPFGDFTKDLMLRLAIERSLEIVCEASHRLPDDVKSKNTDIDWQAIVDFGNRLRHAYHRIEPNILWQIIERDLPPLKTFAKRVMSESE
jgi:uncharacterized protein with HEPN domain